MKITELPDPSQWICVVDFYHDSHNELQLALSRKQTNEVLFAGFIAVEYFEGPMVWEGAGFGIQPRGECLNLLEVFNIQYDKLYFDYALFVCPVLNSHNSKATVRIIASPHVTVTTERLLKR